MCISATGEVLNHTAPIHSGLASDDTAPLTDCEGERKKPQTVFYLHKKSVNFKRAF